jgi:hypothetical protein
MEVDKGWRFIAAVAALIFVIGAILGTLDCLRTQRVLKHGKTTLGTVLESRGDKGETVGFANQSGQQFKVWFGRSVFDQDGTLKIGEKVTVVYDPSSPTHALDRPVHSIRRLLLVVLFGLAGPPLGVWGLAPVARWFKVAKHGR